MLYFVYIIIGLLYVVVKIIFVALGYLHLGAIGHGAIVAVPITIAGILSLKERSRSFNRRIWHGITIVLPILVFIITPIYMYIKMGSEQWLTEGRLPVLMIYECFAVIQSIIAISLWKKHIAVEILPRALWVIMALSLFLGQHLTDSPPEPTENIFFACVGVCLTILGSFFFIYVGYYIRRALANKDLVTTGPYRYIRHPMYVSIYVMLSGIGLLFFSEVWFLIMLAFVPIWYVDCWIEERQMTGLHEMGYSDYIKRTGMFIPRLMGGKE